MELAAAGGTPLSLDTTKVSFHRCIATVKYDPYNDGWRVRTRFHARGSERITANQFCAWIDPRFLSLVQSLSISFFLCRLIHDLTCVLSFFL